MRIEKSLKLLNKILAVALALLMLSLTGCGGKAESAVSVPVDAKPVYPSATDLSSHYCVTDNLKEIAASGLITLLFDENSTSIGVRINNGGESKLWSALPQASSGETPSDEAEIIGLEVIHDSKRYFLNSQDNSVAVGCAVWGSTENGYRIEYLITDDASCIDNIGFGASDEVYMSAAENNILYKVNVTYTLADGCLYAKLEWKNLGNQKDVLSNIGFLEYFGASETAQAGDFILVPDGSGAQIDLASADKVEPVNIAVYGDDFGSSAELRAVVPAYGLKNGSGAFAAIIEQGDALAEISANKALSGSNYNRVGASFAVTPSQVEDGQQYFSQLSYTGEISICFRFLNGSDATYAGLAAACREQLVRNHTLSNGSVQVTEYMPVIVNTVGQAKKDGFLSISKKMTTFDEAVDMLTRIKSKGINNVYLRYSGALSGGLNAENANGAKVLSSLGGKSDLRALNDYAAGLNFNIFMDVSLVSDSSSNGKTVGDLLTSKAYYTQKEVFNKAGLNDAVQHRYITSLSRLESTVLSVLEELSAFKSVGICVEDAGKVLYTDYKNVLGREAACDIIGTNVQSLATQNLIMIENGNFYALKNADIVSGLPMTCSRTADDSYKPVPFVQIILHGIVEFSGSELNFVENTEEEFLRCIEYGSIPSFALTNDMLIDSDEYRKIFSVDNWLNSMYSCYSRSNDVLNDLRGSRITNQYEVSQGVYCTEYESTTRIYVNYTDTAVTVSGITVEPMSFFRVN